MLLNWNRQTAWYALPVMEVLNAAAAGHVRIFQYRNKTASMKDALIEAGPLRRRARELNVLFLVNDRCDLALAINADGVHLGQSDLPYLKARQLLGEQKYIGLSTHNAGQVKEAEQLRPDYIGFGPIFTPASKTDHAIGAMSIGLYRDVLDEEAAYLLNYGEARLVFAEDEEQVDKLLNLADRAPHLKHIVYSDPRGMPVGMARGKFHGAMTAVIPRGSSRR